MSTNTNYSKIAERLSEKLAAYFESAGRENAVVGLSGGLDSAVTAYLLVKALGEHRVFGVILPSSATHTEDLEHAHIVTRSLGIDHYRFDLSDLAHSTAYRITGHGLTPQDNVSIGNITARLRSLFLYNIASRRHALVTGTGDRSEFLLGYFTKYGDGAADVMPLGSLYKTEVRQLAKALGVPEAIIKKPSSPGLWHGQTAEAELGAKYEKIDEALRLLVDRKMKPSAVAKKIRNRDLVERVCGLMEAGAHKRNMPPILQP